ncbi:MAG: hypothetical protein IJ124_06805 [Clostridia bacterium]|nr:hypothetical protein [Clostridia bacterium]
MAGIKPVQSLYYRRRMSGAEGILYDAILAGVLGGRQNVKAESLRGLDLARIILALQHDHPEAFYWDASKTLFTQFGAGTQASYSIDLSYFYPLRELPARQKRIADSIARLLNGADRLPPFERMVHLHDALALSISYGGEENKPFHYYTLEGPLAGGVGVCAGIARAYKYLMNLGGLSCMVVYGTTKDAQGKTGTHAWNIVHVDGHCHHVDVTWDDNNDSYLSHAYLALSDEEIRYNHWASADFPLPPCASSRCPLPVARDIPALAEAMVAQHALKQAVTEVRVPGIPGQGAEIYQKLRNHCWIGRKGRACNAIKSYGFDPGNHVFAFHWR